MSARNNLDLDSYLRVIERVRVLDAPRAKDRTRIINDYGADKSLVQTMARLADYVAAKVAQASQ